MKRCRLPRWLGLLALPALLASLPATTVVPPDFDKLVDSADYVVRASVKSVVAERRPNPGKPGQSFIGTRVELEVLEVISGTPPSPLVLSLAGGRIGEEELIIDGAPRFTVGQESILFIQGNGRQIVPLVRMHHGFYPVRRDKRTGEAQVMRSSGKLLYNQQEVSLPPAAASAAPARDPQAKPLTPAEFSTLIRQRYKANDRERLK